MKLPLCIVGCGNWAGEVMDEIHDMTDEFEFWFASRDPSKAKAYCNRYNGTGAFGSYEEAATDSHIKAMYFLTPHDLHLDNARLACSNGKHVLVEKPIARTIQEAQKLASVAKDANVSLMIAENFRFLPTVSKAIQLIAQGIVGKLRSVEIEAKGPETAIEWRANRSRTGGGRFIDAGVHYIDILVRLGGFPDRLYATELLPKIQQIDGEDGIAMIAHLPGDVTGTIVYSGSTPPTNRVSRIEASGTEGVISFEPFGEEVLIDTLDGQTSFPVESAHRGLRRMLQEFRSSIVEHRSPVMSAIEATKDLAIVLAVYESTRTRQTVDLVQPIIHR